MVTSIADGSDVRIGIIGTDNGHAYSYTAFLNGWSEAAPIPSRLPNGGRIASAHQWAHLLRRLQTYEWAAVPVPGARVTAIWSADPDDAKRLAQACDVERVCDRPEQACDDVDAVMVLSEAPETHLPHARHALERGLPTFIDKPLAENMDACREILSLAQHHAAPCFSASSLRWSPELVAARAWITNQLDPVRAVHVACPRDLELYGIHAVEMVNMFLGHKVHTVRSIAVPDRHATLLDYHNGNTALFEHIGVVRGPTYGLTAYGETWTHRVAFDEVASCALSFIRAFVAFVRGGPVPVPASEQLRLMAIVDAARASLASDTEIAF